MLRTNFADKPFVHDFNMPYSLFFACFAIACYGLISLHLMQILKQSEQASQPQLTTTPHWLALTYVTAFAAHSINLYDLILSGNYATFGLAASLSLCSLFMGCLLVLLSKQPPVILGLIVFPLCALNLFAANITHNHFPTRAELSVSNMMHILASITAYALLALGFLQALIVMLQNRFLKQKTAHRLLPHLPPLEANENVLFNLLATGVILLTVSITTGWLFHENLFTQKLIHKTVFSILAWCIFSLVIIGRFLLGWRGPTAIKWTQAGFVLLALGYIGSKAVIQLLATSAS